MNFCLELILLPCLIRCSAKEYSISFFNFGYSSAGEQVSTFGLSHPNVVLPIIGIAALACAMVAGAIAYNRGKNPIGWVVVTVIWPLNILFALQIPKNVTDHKQFNVQWLVRVTLILLLFATVWFFGQSAVGSDVLSKSYVKWLQTGLEILGQPSFADGENIETAGFIVNFAHERLMLWSALYFGLVLALHFITKNRLLLLVAFVVGAILPKLVVYAVVLYSVYQLSVGNPRSSIPQHDALMIGFFILSLGVAIILASFNAKKINADYVATKRTEI